MYKTCFNQKICMNNKEKKLAHDIGTNTFLLRTSKASKNEIKNCFILVKITAKPITQIIQFFKHYLKYKIMAMKIL